VLGMQERETDFVVVDGIMVPESAFRREGWERRDGLGRSGEGRGEEGLAHWLQ
jgi:hypothetical protein